MNTNRVKEPQILKLSDFGILIQIRRKRCGCIMLFVIQICVEKSFRGQGIGELFLNTLYERHHQNKAFILECTISPENLASQKTFQKFAQNHNGSWSWQNAWFESAIPERKLRKTEH